MELLILIISVAGISLFAWEGFKATESSQFYYSDENITIPTIIERD